VGAGLARDAGAAVFQVHRGDPFAASLKLDSSYKSFVVYERWRFKKPDQ
jgi:hypothetical protein